MDQTYNGVIVVTDIDDTLRPFSMSVLLHKTIPPLKGSLELLNELASEKGFPIVYLSAAPASMMATKNTLFLKEFPRGRMFMRSGVVVSPMASDQQAFKQSVLGEIQKAYPRATFLCLGDDQYYDANAYTGCKYKYIRSASWRPAPPPVPKWRRKLPCNARTKRRLRNVHASVG